MDAVWSIKCSSCLATAHSWWTELMKTLQTSPVNYVSEALPKMTCCITNPHWELLRCCSRLVWCASLLIICWVYFFFPPFFTAAEVCPREEWHRSAGGAQTRAGPYGQAWPLPLRDEQVFDSCFNSWRLQIRPAQRTEAVCGSIFLNCVGKSGCNLISIGAAAKNLVLLLLLLRNGCGIQAQQNHS